MDHRDRDAGVDGSSPPRRPQRTDAFDDKRAPKPLIVSCLEPALTVRLPRSAVRTLVEACHKDGAGPV